MTVYRVEIPLAMYEDYNLDMIAEWCWDQWAGPVPKDIPTGGIQGKGWVLYHTTTFMQRRAVTVGEFDSKDKSTVFKLRWGDASL